MNLRNRNRLLIVSVVLLGAGVPGCAVFSWVVAQFAPPQKVKALYKPPEKKKYLVFVDDLRQEMTYEPVKRQLTRQLNKQLIEHKIAKEVVPYERLVNLSVATPEFNSLSVPTVGRKLKADVVLYVEITKFSVRDDEVSPLWHGVLAVSVKIVDPEVGRIWPEDRESGYPVDQVETPLTDDPSPSYGVELSGILAKDMADKIVKMFYDHRVPAQQIGVK